MLSNHLSSYDGWSCANQINNLYHRCTARIPSFHFISNGCLPKIHGVACVAICQHNNATACLSNHLSPLISPCIAKQINMWLHFRRVLSRMIKQWIYCCDGEETMICLVMEMTCSLPHWKGAHGYVYRIKMDFWFYIQILLWFVFCYVWFFFAIAIKQLNGSFYLQAWYMIA